MNPNFDIQRDRYNDSVKYISNNQVSLKIVNDSLKEILVDKQIFKIGKVLGKSNAIVWHIDSSPADTPVCLKISAGGKTDLDNDKIKYINNHPNDFTKIYYFAPNIDLNSEIILEGKKFTTIDICILEEVQKTVGDFCNMLMNRNANSSTSYTFSYNFISVVLHRLLEIIGTLTKNGYYYTDLKPANIGVINAGDHYDFKLIDVDSIFKKESGMLHTSYTTGYINNKISLIRIQYLNIIFTIISLLFVDNASAMCSKDYGKFRINNTMNSFMSWFNDAYTSCGEYKYILLMGTYMIIAQYIGTNNFNINMIMERYNGIIDSINNVITGNRPSTYFAFIAKILVTMIVIILMPDESYFPDMIPLFIDKPSNINIVPVTYKNILNTISLLPHVSNGIIIVDYLHQYITQFCNDPQCSFITKYGDYFMNIQ